MKRTIAFILVLCISLVLCACTSKIEVAEDSRVVLTFRYEQKNIRRALNDEEAAQIVKIINNKRSFDIANDDPTCQFTPDVSLTVDETVFALARDGCHMMQNMDSLELILLSDAEWEYIEALFVTYDGHFPCTD